MNRKNLTLITGAILLILIGAVIGQFIFHKTPERVVLYENSQSGTGTPVIRNASYLSTEDTGAPSLVDLNNAFVGIAEKVNPSVVTITTTKVIKVRGNSMFPGFDDDLFYQFFGIPPQTERRGTALGSGVIVDKKGYILTNNHVVEQGEKINVRLIDNREFEAKVVGTDPKSDLAVIKIKADNLMPIVLGNSDALRIGEWVLAIGSPFSDNLDHTVTAGIVSAKGRSDILNNNMIQNFIQTDAAINPGNSGGALVNIRGELVGINTAIATNGGAGNLGIGFAIPVNMAKKVLSDLIEHGKVIRAWLGVSIQNIDDPKAKALKLKEPSGVLIGSVVEDGPADKAGLEVGDVIIEFDGIKVKNVSSLQVLVSNSEVGKEKDVVVIRNKRKKTIRVKLEEMPGNMAGQSIASSSKTSKLGITVDNLTPYLAQQYGVKTDEKGVIVTSVDRSSEAGQVLRPGDLIQRIGDQNIKDVDDYNKALEQASGEYILVLVKRKENTFFVTLKIEE
ncbi:MAG: DegQ family serine endoprotease [Candidatus Marinimicrobia bacterium]|nr:DegQ family serine endoprotease [Candidatus Neomarinimicrobiota bacterium]